MESILVVSGIIAYTNNLTLWPRHVYLLVIGSYGAAGPKSYLPRVFRSESRQVVAKIDRVMEL